MVYELECRYDTRQCFYGKAKVSITFDGRKQIQTLLSYGTEVAEITRQGNKIICEYYGNFSQTTTRHQKEFFRQNGLTEKEIKKLFKDGSLEINI